LETKETIQGAYHRGALVPTADNMFAGKFEKVG
jgi:hypothetical protein